MILYYNFATTWPTCYFFPNPGCLNVKTIVRFEQHSSSSFGGSLFNTSMMFGIEKVKHSDPLHPRKASSYGHFYFDRWYLQKFITDFFALHLCEGALWEPVLSKVHGRDVRGHQPGCHPRETGPWWLSPECMRFLFWSARSPRRRLLAQNGTFC